MKSMRGRSAREPFTLNLASTCGTLSSRTIDGRNGMRPFSFFEINFA